MEAKYLLGQFISLDRYDMFGRPNLLIVTAPSSFLIEDILKSACRCCTKERHGAVISWNLEPDCLGSSLGSPT